MPNDSAFATPLPHLGILHFSGADALTFLQGQVSNDTRLLSQNKPLLAAYSSPQGRVLALIYLLPHSSGVAAIMPREILTATQERMRKFVLRAKVHIEAAGDELVVAGQIGSTAEWRDGYLEQDGIGLANVGPYVTRHWAIGPANRMQAADAAQLRRF